jgi:uncharacterized spore protein YtfJ
MSINKELLYMATSAERFSLVENLAETFGKKASAQTIYGLPVEREGVTIIPVGKVRYGLGGGSGNRAEEGEGSGGGGGMMIAPVGYIEIKNGKSKFKRINYPTAILQIVGGLALSTWIVLRGVRAFRHT